MVGHSSLPPTGQSSGQSSEPSPDQALSDRPIILLVDDTPLNLQLLFESLGNSDLKLLAAESGEMALERVTRVKPSMILLDVMMPGLNGFETCRQLKLNPETADIPVIFMTALTDIENKVQGLNLGAVDYITKPIQPDEVVARVKTHLMIHQLRLQLQHQNNQLRQEIQERKQIEQSLKLLLRSVSHDLRNPVNGMMMVLNNLLNGIGVNLHKPQADTIGVPLKTIERMVVSCDRQLQLINSLLASHSARPPSANSLFSSSLSDSPQSADPQSASPQTESDRSEFIFSNAPSNTSPSLQNIPAIPSITIDLQYQSVHIPALVDSIIQDIQPLLNSHPATLTCHVPSDLPPIQADPTQLWRVLENLVTNAIKHNPSGVNVVVTMRKTLASESLPLPRSTAPCPQVASDNELFLICTVKDNGGGISEQEQTILFDPYERGAEVGQTPGLGLGLYLCQQIIQAHGGTIGINSQLNAGTTFWFTVPWFQKIHSNNI